ncbi:hypothetical protein QVD17_09036 [Tagetes erecta]|uniref:Uncharacterized protein n=1 Tax=Tagetes erecta TaxID=13708 RepID=A0AAD8L0U0_TARER|nr:hypothetical protein QVD17_09036 [Tagetes erecta]
MTRQRLSYLNKFKDVLPDEPQDVPVAQVELVVEGEVEVVVSSSESDNESEKDNDINDGDNDGESSSNEDGDDDTGEFVFVQHNTRVLIGRLL